MKTEKVCCPEFKPATLDKKTFKWNNKLFVKTKVVSFLHIPLNIGSMMKKTCGAIEKSKASNEDFIVLTDEKSLWGSDWYFAVTKKISGFNHVNISGTFLTKVYEGPYRNIGNWDKDLRKYVNSKGKKVKKVYFFYTTCPKCAKKYGKNYVVGFAQV